MAKSANLACGILIPQVVFEILVLFVLLESLPPCAGRSS
jgi:hypothetical protein